MISQGTVREWDGMDKREQGYSRPGNGMSHRIPGHPTAKSDNPRVFHPYLGCCCSCCCIKACFPKCPSHCCDQLLPGQVGSIWEQEQWPFLRASNHQIVALTGHISDCVLPMNRWMPFLNGSILDCLMATLITMGHPLPHHKNISGLLGHTHSQWE